jgi:hypothetical protein
VQSINTCQIPEDWKNANIVSIFRKGDRSKPSNYRPVSLTPVASKILEHIIVSQIDVTQEHLDASPSTTPLWILSLRNASIHILVVPSMP